MGEFEGPEKAVVQRKEITKSTSIENIELIPMKVHDLRDPRLKAFDLDKFIGVIGRLRSEGLFKFSREFEDDYGKYMSVFESRESDNRSEAVQKAKAIEIPPRRHPVTDTNLSRVEHWWR
jgi:hypothetical protein